MRFFTSFGTLLVLLVVGLAGILGEAIGALFSGGNKKMNTPLDPRRA